MTFPKIYIDNSSKLKYLQLTKSYQYLLGINSSVSFVKLKLDTFQFHASISFVFTVLYLNMFSTFLIYFRSTNK